MRCDANRQGKLVTAGGLGKWAQWKVEKKGRKIEGCPVVGFRNVGNFKEGERKCWLAIKANQMCTGGGGEHCEFIVKPNGKAIKLIKAKNQSKACGINKKGEFKKAGNLGDGDGGKWFIFDCDDISG